MACWQWCLFSIIVLIGTRLSNKASTRETAQGAAGQAGHDVHVADGEGKVNSVGVKFQILSLK